MLTMEDRVKQPSFNWLKFSRAIAIQNPHLFDAEKFDWANKSYLVPEYCPEHFDAARYNWEDFDEAVCKYLPVEASIDNCKIENLGKYCPERLLAPSMQYANGRELLDSRGLYLDYFSIKEGFDLDGTLLTTHRQIPWLDKAMYGSDKTHSVWSRIRHCMVRRKSRIAPDSDRESKARVIITTRAEKNRAMTMRLLEANDLANCKLIMYPKTIRHGHPNYNRIVGAWKLYHVLDNDINIFYDDHLGVITEMRRLARENYPTRNLQFIHVHPYSK